MIIKYFTTGISIVTSERSIYLQIGLVLLFEKIKYDEQTLNLNK